jgi:hypothetical protein
MIVARTKEANHLKIDILRASSAGLAEETLRLWLYMVLMGS